MHCAGNFPGQPANNTDMPKLLSSLTTVFSSAIRNRLRTPVRAIARSIGFDVVPYKPQPDAAMVSFELLLKLRNAMEDVHDKSDRQFLLDCAKHIGDSKSQLLQDLFALHVLDQKRSGFFVEFGSTNGVNLSNTHILEMKFGWNGILAEPARCWAAALQTNRRCAIDLRCVWTTTGEKLRFLEASDAELSTIDPFADRDAHSTTRMTNEKYEVETISLTDLLRAHNAPHQIDYLSIDTEGSEYSILSHFDFEAFDISVVTVEHNYVEKDRTQIQQLLTAKGYRRVFEKFSQWDDWYVKQTRGTVTG
jgi:FkbM family methyltransferase